MGNVLRLVCCGSILARGDRAAGDLHETFKLKGVGLSVFTWATCALLLYTGARAVIAVTVA